MTVFSAYAASKAEKRPPGNRNHGLFWLIFGKSGYTLENERLEPENHLFEKEQHLPNLHFGVLCVFFRGVSGMY